MPQRILRWGTLRFAPGTHVSYLKSVLVPVVRPQDDRRAGALAPLIRVAVAADPSRRVSPGKRRRRGRGARIRQAVPLQRGGAFGAGGGAKFRFAADGTLGVFVARAFLFVEPHLGRRREHALARHVGGRRGACVATQRRGSPSSARATSGAHNPRSENSRSFFIGQSLVEAVSGGDAIRPARMRGPVAVGSRGELATGCTAGAARSPNIPVRPAGGPKINDSANRTGRALLACRGKLEREGKALAIKPRAQANGDELLWSSR